MKSDTLVLLLIGGVVLYFVMQGGGSAAGSTGTCQGFPCSNDPTQQSLINEIKALEAQVNASAAAQLANAAADVATPYYVTGGTYHQFTPNI